MMITKRFFCVSIEILAINESHSPNYGRWLR